MGERLIGINGGKYEVFRAATVFLNALTDILTDPVASDRPVRIIIDYDPEKTGKFMVNVIEKEPDDMNLEYLFPEDLPHAQPKSRQFSALEEDAQSQKQTARRAPTGLEKPLLQESFDQNDRLSEP